MVIYKDKSKNEILDILQGLRNEALNFENNHHNKEILAIAIINIGSCIDPILPNHKNLLKDRGVDLAPRRIFEYEDYFELTCNGEVLNLNEYACLIADTRLA